jgi:hypothetical protein
LRCWFFSAGSTVGTLGVLVSLVAPLLASALITSVYEIRTKADADREIAAWSKRFGKERLFAWLHNFRHTVIRWGYYLEKLLGMVQLACAVILPRRL